jgi:hypothetical protein
VSLSRAAAVDRLETLLETVESEPLPVPIREVWILGDVALGLDPVERLDVYLTKDLLFGRDEATETEFRDAHGIAGVGKTVDAAWAEQFPQHLRATETGHAAPERCLAAHLVDPDEPIHLEVCNSGFEDNVSQRLAGARAREQYEEIIDPRGVCLWAEGQRSETALQRLRQGDFAFPTLAEALEMLGVDPEAAERGAKAARAYRTTQDGRSVRGDVV